MVNLTGFSAHTQSDTKDRTVGASYLNQSVFDVVETLVTHIEKLVSNPDKSILRDYLEDVATWLGLNERPESETLLSHQVPRLVLAHIAAMMWIFDSANGEKLQAGYLALPNEVKTLVTESCNPLKVIDKPTPTYAPALFNNLLKLTGDIRKAMSLGLPIYAKALQQYALSDLRVPLSFNSLAKPDSIRSIIASEGTEYSVSLDPTTGAIQLEAIQLAVGVVAEAAATK